MFTRPSKTCNLSPDPLWEFIPEWVWGTETRPKLDGDYYI